MLKAMGAEVHVCPAHVAADDPRSYYEVASDCIKKLKVPSISINTSMN